MYLLLIKNESESLITCKRYFQTPASSIVSHFYKISSSNNYDNKNCKNI